MQFTDTLRMRAMKIEILGILKTTFVQPLRTDLYGSYYFVKADLDR